MAVDMEEVRAGKGIARKAPKPLEKVVMQLGDMRASVLKRDEEEFRGYGYRTVGPLVEGHIHRPEPKTKVCRCGRDLSEANSAA